MDVKRSKTPNPLGTLGAQCPKHRNHSLTCSCTRSTDSRHHSTPSCSLCRASSTVSLPPCSTQAQDSSRSNLSGSPSQQNTTCIPCIVRLVFANVGNDSHS